MNRPNGAKLEVGEKEVGICEVRMFYLFYFKFFSSVFYLEFPSIFLLSQPVLISLNIKCFQENWCGSNNEKMLNIFEEKKIATVSSLLTFCTLKKITVAVPFLYYYEILQHALSSPKSLLLYDHHNIMTIFRSLPLLYSAAAALSTHRFSPRSLDDCSLSYFWP